MLHFKGFVVYNQDCSYVASSSPISLTKQTFQVMTTTALGLRRWHLVAYFLSDRGCNLDTVDDKPELAGLEVPHENYPVPIGGLRRTKASSSLMMPPVPRGALQTSVENIPLPVPKILVPLDSLKAHGTGTRRACDQAMLDSLLRRGSLS
ncbi:hypothetical protein DL96DRAFT_1608005 [Flagelloscypha sp. PMI_526]|nr:hypothetical protein DL96DRAFT_1608005 [Flagelloscypha sp. PMI_526]